MNEFELPMFEIAMIEAATRNFSSYNKIGEGGFGPVYKVNYSLCGYLLTKQYYSF